MSHSMQTVDQEFLMEFTISRKTRKPRRDRDGEYVWSLWRIINKCKLTPSDPQLYYEIQYWEQETIGEDPVFLELDHVIEQNYQGDAESWEKKFGDDWRKKYGPTGRIWPGPPDPLSKRVFDDTPSKPRQLVTKKSKFGSDSDEEMNDDSDGNPFSSQVSQPARQWSMAPPPLPLKPRPILVSFASGSPRSSRSRSQSVEPDDDDDDDDVMMGMRNVSPQPS
ncbi:hypothetical protein ONS96_003208 [Cadophora gregata f. sp. sojae]|nr:hypothetical protein ONS96_003208 [Cadophora gregata f. sp. sojae]